MVEVLNRLCSFHNVENWAVFASCNNQSETSVADA